MSDKCLTCGKELKHVEGRRKKSYCDKVCKSSYWNKRSKNYQTKYTLVPNESYNKFKAIEEKIAEGVIDELINKNFDGLEFKKFSDNLFNIGIGIMKIDESGAMKSLDYIPSQTKVEVKDLTKPTNVVKQKEVPKSNYSVNTVGNLPTKREGESALDFAIRKSEWEENK